MSENSSSKADLAGGLALVAVGLWFLTQSYGLELGTARRMGPGYFPLFLSVLLIVLGAIIGLKPFLTLPWRGPVFILAAPIFFGLTVRGLGFGPALFLATLLAGQASRRMTPVASLVLAAGVTAFSVGVFLYGLSLPYRPIGPWLRFGG